MGAALVLSTVSSGTGTGTVRYGSWLVMGAALALPTDLFGMVVVTGVALTLPSSRCVVELVVWEGGVADVCIARIAVD